MRVFNGQTADGLECSASLVMRKRGRWVLVVAIGTRRNGVGAVVLPSGVQPYEIPMGSSGQPRPADRDIGRAIIQCIEADAEHRHTERRQAARRAVAPSARVQAPIVAILEPGAISDESRAIDS